MFKRITAKNLFSWEALNYEVSSGISQITGFNYDDGTSEGSGKSSIPNILCWVLYGGIPKSARIDDVIRQGCDGGSGEVALDSGHCVFRSRRPNDLAIRTPDGEIVKGKDAKETQQLINKLIGLDFAAFCQTVYFAQDYTNKFIVSSETDKVSILSEIQDLSKLDRARKDVQEVLKKEVAEKMNLERQLEHLEAEGRQVSSNMDLLETFLKKFESDQKERLAKLKRDEAGLSKRLEEIHTYIAKFSAEDIEEEIAQRDTLLKALEEKKLECTVAVATAEATKQNQASLKKNLKSFELSYNQAQHRLSKLHKEDPAGTCPTCGQAASPEKLSEHKAYAAAQRVEITKELENYAQHKDRLTKELQSMKDAPSTEGAETILEEIAVEAKALNGAKKKLWQMQADHKNLLQESKVVKDNLGTLAVEIAVVKDQTPTKELAKLKDLEGKLIAVDSNIDYLQDALYLQNKKIQNYEILKTGFKEVKQYIFQSLLNELSEKSTCLASDLFEVPVKVEFSNETEEGGISKIKTIVTLDGSERSIGLLSGGQLSRVTLAVDLALAAIVASRSENPLNFRVLDEPFKNLSEVSMAKVVELLSKLNGSTIIIEHNSIIKSIIHRTFNIEYRDGVSNAA